MGSGLLPLGEGAEHLVWLNHPATRQRDTRALTQLLAQMPLGYSYGQSLGRGRETGGLGGDGEGREGLGTRSVGCGSCPLAEARARSLSLSVGV